MLPLNSQLLVSSATALAAWYGHREPKDADDDRAAADTRRADASISFVYFVGFWSHFASDSCCSSWPLPRCERIEELAHFAQQHGGIVPSPEAGDVFLLASFDGGQHIAAGIVSSIERVTTMLDGSFEFICTTIEGEVGAPSTGDAAPPLVTARLVRRRLSTALGDCFIRWWCFPAEESPADIDYVDPNDVVRLRRSRPPKATVRLRRARAGKMQ